MDNGDYLVFIEGETYKKKEAMYRQKSKKEYEDDGIAIEGNNVNVADISIENGKLKVDLDQDGVFVSTTIPLSFELKIKIAAELKNDLDTLKQLKMIGD